MDYTLIIDGRSWYTGPFYECITRAYYCHNAGCIVRADTYELVVFFRYASYPDGYGCVVMSPIKSTKEFEEL